MTDAGTLEITLIDVTDDAALGRWIAVQNAVMVRQYTIASFHAEMTFVVDHGEWLAVLDGVDVGAGAVGWSPASVESGVAFFDIAVLPDARRRGVGTALADLAIVFARDQGLRVARSSTPDGEADGLRFATRYGLEVVGSGQDGYLDLTPAHAAAQATLPPGVSITSFAERPDLERAIYDLDALVHPEVPTMALGPVPSFEAWQAQTSADPGFLRDLSLLALRDDRLIGMLLMYDNAEGTAYIGMAAVDPGSRRLGVARALKVELAARAARAGWHRLETFNDGANERMRGLNEELGYIYRPRLLSLRGPLPTPMSEAVRQGA